MANNSENENRSLREQLELLNRRLKIQEESYSISTSLIDSLKEALGIQSRTSEFDKAILKTNKEINEAILEQRTGLSNINKIQRQIQKNDDLLKKNKLIEQSLLSSIGGQLSRNGQIIANRIKKQAEQNKQLEEYNKRIEEGQSIDLASYNQLKSRISINEQLIEQEFTRLSALEQQYLLTQQNTKALEEQQKGRKAEKAIQKELKSQLGFAGKFAKFFGTIPGLGDSTKEALEEVNEELNEMVESSGELPSRWKTFSMLVSKTMTSLDKGFTDPAFLLLGLINILKELDSSAENYARSMNVTYKEALKTKNEMQFIAGITKTQILESQAFINKELGTSVKLTQENTAAFTQLHILAGMTQEELMGITSLSLANGKNIKQNTNEFLKQAKITSLNNKVVLNEKQLLAEIGKISKATTLSLSKNPKELAKAAATAKALGMEMSKLEAISEELLNFESSIENELSAELLTGKDLNLERARLLALNNDIAGVAEEINKQIGSSADYAKMNRIQQEALAKAVGMNREELAETLYTQEQIRNVGEKEAEERQRIIDKLIEEHGLAEAQRMIREEGFEKLKDQAGIQTQFNQAILELKELLGAFILPAFVQIGDFVREHLGLIKAVVGIYIALKAAQLGFIATQKIALALGKQQKILTMSEAAASIVKGGWSSLGVIPFVGAGLAVAAIAAGIAYLFSQTSKGNDVFSPAAGGNGYGKRTLLGPEGAIQLNNKDTVIAGTNLFGNDVRSSPNKPTQMGNAGTIKVKADGGGGDTAAIIAAINSLANRPINVSIDGKKVIEATTGAQPNAQGAENRKNSYKVQ